MAVINEALDGSDFSYIEPGGMASLDVSRSQDGGVYVEATSYGWHEDHSGLIHLPPERAIELGRWLLAQFNL